MKRNLCRNPRCAEVLKYDDDGGGFCPSCRFAYFIGMKAGAALMFVAGFVLSVLWSANR